MTAVWDKQRPPKESKQRLFILSLLQRGSRPPGLAFGSYSKASREVEKVYSGNGGGSRCSLSTGCWWWVGRLPGFLSLLLSWKWGQKRGNLSVIQSQLIWDQLLQRETESDFLQVWLSGVASVGHGQASWASCCRLDPASVLIPKKNVSTCLFHWLLTSPKARTGRKSVPGFPSSATNPLPICSISTAFLKPPTLPSMFCFF